MNDDIPFDKNFTLKPDQVQEVALGVRAMVADNPGPFTYKGTISYIVGSGSVAIIDPGPDDIGHINALLNAVRARPSAISLSPTRIAIIPLLPRKSRRRLAPRFTR